MPEKKKNGARRQTRVLAQVALLIALEIVLNRYGSINTAWLKIGFSFLPMALCAMLFGPLWAAAAYAIADFAGYWLNPLGPYHPGFTVCAALMGLVYGLFLYRNTFSLQSQSQTVTFEMRLRWERYRFIPNYLVPVFINTVILGLLLNTLWISELYGSKTYWGWFVYRLPQFAVLIPLNFALLPLLSRLAGTLKKAGFM